jgi:peroxiredoxin
VGKPAPPFSVVDATGKVRSLAEFRGRTVVLEWTNKDCPYVEKHYRAGAMQRLQSEAASDGVVWLSIISSAPGKQGHLAPAKALTHAAEVGATPAAILIDASGVMGRAYGAKTTPHMYVINAQGTLVYAGAIDDRKTTNPADVAKAKNYVAAALADLKAGRPVAFATSPPYGCSIKY